MECNVPSDIKVAITPEMIFINKNTSQMLAMIGTLDYAEYEALGAWVVFHSQEAGHWIAFIRPDKGEYDNMVTDGYLSEIQVATGWRYELTPFAIEQIFVRQTEQKIRRLNAKIQSLQPETIG